MAKWLPLVFLVACGGGGSSTPVCGDGVLDDGEECDDGNTNESDGCTSTCVVDVAACGDGVLDPGEQCDDGNNLDLDGCSADCNIEGEVQHSITSTWTFRDLATNTTTACPGSGFDTAAITVTPTGGGTPIIDLFDCTAGTGTADYPPDSYDIQLAITNGGGMDYATSLPEVVDITTADATFTPTIFNDAGYFSLTWELRGAVSNNVLTCSGAGVQDIAIDATVTGGATLSSDLLDCNSGGSTGITTAFLMNSYTLAMSGTDANQQALGPPTTQVNKVIMAPNKVTALGTVVILISGQ